MHQRLFLTVLTFFSFVYKYETKQQIGKDIPYILTQLFEDNSKPPIILYLEPKQGHKSDVRIFEEPTSREHDVEGERPVLRTSQNDERAYFLYHLLRTTLNDGDLDPAAAGSIQETKQLLRQALIGRCRQLNNCVKKCPEVSFTCTVKCKQVFDDLDACDEPEEPKCNQSKCGHTMPPSWLL